MNAADDPAIRAVTGLGELIELTLDAYITLCNAVHTVIPGLDTDRQETLVRALEESTMMINFGIPL